MGFLDKVRGGRKRVEPHGLWADDAEQLTALEARGADITAPRESEFFVSFTSSAGVSDAADDLRGGEFLTRSSSQATTYQSGCCSSAPIGCP